jgi:hypothetical protein
MQDQGQGWVSGAIITAAIAGIGIYLFSNSDKASDAAGTATSRGRSAFAALESSEVGQRGGRILQLALTNTSSHALEQVKALLKDGVRQLDQLVDEL